MTMAAGAGNKNLLIQHSSFHNPVLKLQEPNKTQKVREFCFICQSSFEGKHKKVTFVFGSKAFKVNPNELTKYLISTEEQLIYI